MKWQNEIVCLYITNLAYFADRTERPGQIGDAQAHMVGANLRKLNQVVNCARHSQEDTTFYYITNLLHLIESHEYGDRTSESEVHVDAVRLKQTNQSVRNTYGV